MNLLVILARMMSIAGLLGIIYACGFIAWNVIRFRFNTTHFFNGYAKGNIWLLLVQAPAAFLGGIIVAKAALWIVLGYHAVIICAMFLFLRNDKRQLMSQLERSLLVYLPTFVFTLLLFARAPECSWICLMLLVLGLVGTGVLIFKARDSIILKNW